MIYNLLTFLFIFLTLFYQQEEKKNLILWSDSYEIQWKDFTYKKPKSEYHQHAGSFLRFIIDPYLEENMPNYHVYAYFNKSLSWTTDTTSIGLLNHERVHFQKKELFARKIRKGILGLRKSKVTKVSTYESLIKRNFELNDKMQDKYDAETDHSLKEYSQKDWEVRIGKELQNMSDYAVNP
jgi:hypothetical protein